MAVKVKKGAAGGPNAPNARGGRGATARGKKGRGKKQKKKKKEKLKCGENGKYGDLKKKTGEGKFDRDHVPSKASLKERARKLRGGQKLCDKQQTAIDNAGLSIAIPKWAHQFYSPTYGNKNNPTRIKKDAKNLQTAARRDTAAVKRGMKKKGASKECQKKYAEWAKQVNAMTPKQYDSMLKKAMGK
jgi:hypothetical protein